MSRVWMKVAGVIIVFALVMILMVQNASPVGLRVFFWGFSLPLIVLLFITFMLGVVVGLVLMSLSLRKK